MKKIIFLLFLLPLMGGLWSCGDDNDFPGDSGSSIHKYPFVGHTYYYDATTWGSDGWRWFVAFDTDSTFNFRTEGLGDSQGEGNESPEIGKFTFDESSCQIKNISMQSYRSGYRNYRLTLYNTGTFNEDFTEVEIPVYLLFNSGKSKYLIRTFKLLE